MKYHKKLDYPNFNIAVVDDSIWRVHRASEKCREYGFLHFL